MGQPNFGQLPTPLAAHHLDHDATNCLLAKDLIKVH